MEKKEKPPYHRRLSFCYCLGFILRRHQQQ
nr:MAG TPA: hypothetical protein [Caudoviricetes sp.]